MGSSAANLGSSWGGENNPSRCADSPTGRCNNCIGTVYLTLDKRPDNGKYIESIEEALQFRNFPRESYEGSAIQCDEVNFGDYMNNGVYFNRDSKDKQIFEDGMTKCFCEPGITETTYACADQDEDCFFNGTTS